MTRPSSVSLHAAAIQEIAEAAQHAQDMAPLLPARASIFALAEAQAAVERHLGRPLSEGEGESFRHHIRVSYAMAGS